MSDIERRYNRWRGRQWSWFEAGAGQVLCLLHGGGGTGRAWTHQMQYFKDHYRVIAPDMPGFGQSEWIDGSETTDALGSIILEWMGSIGVDHMVLGGNSMGGRVALGAAMKDPGRIRALLLLDAVGVVLPDVPIVNPLTLPPQQFMSGLVYDPAAYKRNTPYRSLEDAQELNHGRTIFAKYLDRAPIEPDPSWDLGRVNMPTLLLWGREDRIIPLEYGRIMEKSLSDAELVVIDNCGHLPHIEEPQITNQTIAEFLSRRLRNR
ncbi:MAG: alpha/beta hydrolase [Firmicutes bacterium]|nr:alpha/beta hydrolase [Bacillota bacterium]MCL5971328.1 alpha/beta hydrolase [Bacillota bacterium]